MTLQTLFQLSTYCSMHGVQLLPARCRPVLFWRRGLFLRCIRLLGLLRLTLGEGIGSPVELGYLPGTLFIPPFSLLYNNSRPSPTVP